MNDLDISPPYWLCAVAALVLRMHDHAVRNKRIIRPYLSDLRLGHGFGMEDHIAMSHCSRALIEAGEVDGAAELHELLASCCMPLVDWCGLAVTSSFSGVVLVDSDLWVPTEECIDLASLHGSSMADSIEVSLFREFSEQIHEKKGFTRAHGDEIYTAIRQMVIRHPVISSSKVTQTLKDVGARPLAGFMMESIYCPVDVGDYVDGKLLLCGSCGARARRRPGGALYCPISVCREKRDFKLAEEDFDGDVPLEVNSVLQRFWVGPGLDEIEIYDAAIHAGKSATIFPYRDACDIALSDEVGIDVKCRRSPRLLALSLNRPQGIGGLSRYKTKVIAISDHLVSSNPDYLRLMREIIDPKLGLEILSVSDVKKRYL